MSARETGGTRRNTSATRHRHADDIEGGGGGYNRTPQYQDSDDDEPRQRKGEESACETFQKVSMGWLVVLLLGCLWYSEHVSMRRELGQLQTELTLLQADYTRVSVRTAGDEFKIETLAGKIDGGNEALVAPSPADLAGVGDGFPAPPAADPHTALQAATPAAAQDVPHPAGGGTCVSWRQTGGCSSSGDREPDNDKPCDFVVWPIWSGYCECSWGNHLLVARGCTHYRFTCEEVCRMGPDYKVPAPPPPPPEEGRPYSELQNIEAAVKDLRVADCPAKARDFYENVPIVYTWVDGSDPEYQVLRAKHGGPSSVGGARDRDSGELRFSFRALEKFLPWWKGILYVVAPAQTPYWANVSHPRLKIVDQDDLYPPEDKGFLPTFNTNSLEQWLYAVPGIEQAKSFIHMNDDYLFIGPVNPQDLFGETCEGVRVLVENRPVRHVAESDYLASLSSQRKNTWALSVTHSVLTLDSHFAHSSSHPYLKHGPFIYVRKACEDIATKLFRDQTVQSSQHKFRHPEDVVMPFLYSGAIRAVEPNSKMHPTYNVHVTIEPEDEMSKFVLLSLHGIPPAPQTEMHAEKRADAWYERMLDPSNGFKHVAINDEMGETNQTVVSMLHSFYLKLLPEPSMFERTDMTFVPMPMPG